MSKILIVDCGGMERKFSEEGYQILLKALADHAQFLREHPEWGDAEKSEKRTAQYKILLAVDSEEELPMRYRDLSSSMSKESPWSYITPALPGTKYYAFFKHLAEYMVSYKGLYGLFSNPGFGKTTLMMYLIHELSGFGEKCLLFSLHHTKQQVLDRMNRFKLSTDGLLVFDDPLCNFETIVKIMQKEKPQCVFIDYLQLVDGDKCDLIKDLKRITKQFSVPIFFTGTLPRASGDYDLLYRRPELYDLTYLFSPDTSLSNARFALAKMDLIMFLHRHHDCDRGIGTAYRYNISNSAELIIKQRYISDLPASFHFAFSKMID